MKCNISAWCRQTLTDHAKKRIAGFGLLCTLLLAGILSSCTDDEFPEARMNAMQTISDLRATNPRGLVQQLDGTWMSQKCRVPIVGPGRIVTIDNGSADAGNAVDTDLSNYTTTSTEIVNANVYTPIISIRDTHHTYSAGQKVGFIFKETRKSLLSADVLNGITIQTFLQGSDDPQETIVAKGGENSLLNLNLLSINTAGGDIPDREISFEATKNFDEVRLCLYGIGADVISSMDISVKYAFVGENREIRATSEDEFKDYWGPEAPTIGSSNIANSYKIVDSNIGNSAPFTSVAEIASYATVNFHKTIPAGTEIGFRYSSVNLVSISVLGGNAPTISTYNDDDDKAIESSTPNKDLLGIGLIQNTRDAYISIQTTKPCTQVRFTHPSELLGLGGMNVYYAYVREPVKLDPYRLTLTGGITHLCEGNPALIPVESTTLEGGAVLSLAWENRDRENEKTGATHCTLSDDKKFLQVDGAESWEEGRYDVDILLEGEHLYAEVYVHPKETTWKPQDNSTDWNTWGNWTNGVPWDCSNVFIPANVEKYPVLSASGTEEYWCNNIHFASGAELIGQSHLHYKQAFVDMNLSSGAYHLISAPLQAMVTGDMFVAQNVNDWEKWRATLSDGQLPNYFKPINGEEQGNDNNSAYIEQRRNPFIYQRFWNSDVRNETLTRAYNTKGKANTEFTDWSRSFNAVETSYEVGQGFALKAGNGTNATYHFHFPKSFSIYHYYGINGNSLKESSIARTTGQIGRLWTAEQINGLTLKRETIGTLYLFGNPFMAHINIEKFLKANPYVSSVKVYKDGQYVGITRSNVANGAQIAPMQAVFLTATAGTQLPIKLSEDMLEQGKPSTRLTRRMANQVRLTATSNRHSASCVVVSSSSGNDKFNSREDVTLLVGSEEGSGVAVYTIADGKALSIQRMRSATRIPVGFYLKRTGNVSLAFDASDNIWSGWRLKDKQTGRSYPLKGRITLHNVSTGSGRFFLEKVK